MTEHRNSLTISSRSDHLKKDDMLPYIDDSKSLNPQPKLLIFLPKILIFVNMIFTKVNINVNV